MRTPLIALILLPLLLSSQPSPAQEGSTTEQVARLVQRGDALFNNQDSKRATWKAIGFYREALKLDNRSFEANWRTARAMARLADKKRSSGRNSGDLGRKGHYYAVQAIAAAPVRVEGYYWAAICIGEYGKAISIVKALTSNLRGKLLSYLAKARRLDPGYEDGGAERLLAMYHHMLPGPLKDNGKGLELIIQASKHSPGHSRTLYCWARILWGAGRKSEARQKAKQCVTATHGGDKVINRDFQGRCRKLLRDYQG